MSAWLVPPLLLALAAMAGCVAPGAKGAQSADGETAEAGSEAAAQKSLSTADIAALATPSVVSVRTEEGLGTGFVVREDGWVVTNLHVVGGYADVTVVLADKRSLEVLEILNASPEHDLVLLRVAAKKLPVLRLGKSGNVRPGEPVVAIGHPLGLEDTVSNGLVSAVRQIDDLTVLQISAPIAPGSSGGPLLNDRGEVIGVATAILRGGQNLNLGVPSQYVVELMAHPEPMPMAEFAARIAALQKAAPRAERRITRHPIAIFAGCNEQALALIGHGISNAISVGAPLYNQGNIAACYHVYEGAAQDIERRLPSSCRGPKRALAAGRARAAKLDDSDAQAWAMRDAFDGLLEVIERKVGNVPPE